MIILIVYTCIYMDIQFLLLYIYKFLLLYSYKYYLIFIYFLSIKTVMLHLYT